MVPLVKVKYVKGLQLPRTAATHIPLPTPTPPHPTNPHCSPGTHRKNLALPQMQTIVNNNHLQTALTNIIGRYIAMLSVEFTQWVHRS